MPDLGCGPDSGQPTVSGFLFRASLEERVVVLYRRRTCKARVHMDSDVLIVYAPLQMLTTTDTVWECRKYCTMHGVALDGAGIAFHFM